MPTGLLGLESLVDSDPLIPQREERGGWERRMMDRSRDLGSCETSIKINKHPEEIMQTHSGQTEEKMDTDPLKCRSSCKHSDTTLHSHY